MDVTSRAGLYQDGYSGFTMAESVAINFYMNVIKTKIGENHHNWIISIDASLQGEFVDFMKNYKNKTFQFNKKTEDLYKLVQSVWKKTNKECPSKIASFSTESSDLINLSEDENSHLFYFDKNQAAFLITAKLNLPPIKNNS